MACPACRCPQLTYLSLADALNTRMCELKEVPALVALDMSRATKLGEAGTRLALMRLTSLQDLSISGVTNLADQTIQEVGGWPSMGWAVAFDFLCLQF